MISSFSQNKTDSIILKINILKGFEELKRKDTISLEPKLEEALQNDFFNGLRRLDPKDFADQSKAKASIDYYSSPSGVATFAHQYMISTKEAGVPKIFSIENSLYINVAQTADWQEPMIGPDVNNKYATLIIQVLPENIDATIYLNNREICKVSKAKNGIRVHSDEPYIVEIRDSEKEVHCKKTMILKPQEEKKDICVVKK